MNDIDLVLEVDPARTAHGREQRLGHPPRTLERTSYAPAMTIARLIYVSVAPEQAAEAERVWKEECAPLMIKQPGCLSEELLTCVDAPGEYISYSEWESDEAIERYRASAAHEEIRRHTRGLRGGSAPVVKRYIVAG